MCEIMENNENQRNKRNDHFPKIILLILAAEFCERMSYSGMRVFLTLYLRNKLDYTDDEAKEIYHMFNGMVSLCPVFGGIVADNYLGKYRTILYMMFIYVLGNSLVAVTAIPQLMFPGRLCTLLGLFLIAIGTGGIRPCVTAFGGEQFALPEQERLLTLYFSILYFNLCVGSLIAKTLAPIFRGDVHCFGDKDCYPLAFGAPVIVIIISIVVFVCGRRHYKIKDPKGNIVVDFTKCVYLGLKLKITKRRQNKHSHWLESTRHKYDNKFICDVKRTLSILKLFIVTPIFWSLLEQMGSSWALQASRMDGRLGSYMIKPDQLIVLSPISVMSFIALSQKYLYPCLAKWNLLTNPLNKLKLGGIMAALAFVASASVETYLKTTYPELPQKGFTQLRIFNGNHCSVTIYNEAKNISYTIPTLSQFTNTKINVFNKESVHLNFLSNCSQIKYKELILEEKKANSFFLTKNNIYIYDDNIEKSKSGFPIIRFLITDDVKKPIEMYNMKTNNIEVNISTNNINDRWEVFRSKYYIKVGGREILHNTQLESGGVYNIIVAKDTTDYIANVILVTEPNSITILLLIPQFIFLSIAEVMYAVTGSELAFREAPENMKAVVGSIWILMQAFGNILIIIFTRLLVNVQMQTQFIMYASLMFLSMLIFHYQSRNYKFAEKIEDEELQEMKGHSKYNTNEVEYKFNDTNSEELNDLTKQ
ncbi:PREDICTED: peptide transporter family 1-like [Papilio xuthus]|uniref:Peptide transporter family 1-like n=1 Tax=Papilio xuthus TaxID=66420 RepID=A0AAJ6ZGJ9_PAPXU|nr:PREDICTED: peptide transporter family 1-like [Papilio xuthus]